MRRNKFYYLRYVLFFGSIFLSVLTFLETPVSAISLNDLTDARTPRYDNVFLGQNSGAFVIYASSNTGVGSHSLYRNTTGNHNTGVGSHSLSQNTTGIDNSGVGTSSLYYNTTGRKNTGVGSYSLWQNTTGNYNTGVGADSLSQNTTGGYNTGMGAVSFTNLTPPTKKEG